MVTIMQMYLKPFFFFSFFLSSFSAFAAMCTWRAGRLVDGLAQAAVAFVHANQHAGQPGPAYMDSPCCCLGRDSLDFPVLSQVRRLS